MIIQIAHMAGGCGGYDAMTDAALQAFVQAFASRRLERNNFYFDLSGVAAPIALPGSVKTTELVNRIHQISLQHIRYRLA